MSLWWVFFFRESMTSTARIALLLLPLAASSLMACNSAKGEGSPTDDNPPNVSSLASRPLISVVFMHPVGMVITTKYRQPLMDHLTANSPYLFRALFSTQSERNVGMLEWRFATASHLGVVSYLEAKRQFGAIPLARPLNRDGEPVSYCVFVVPEDSPIQSLSDLEGRSLALGSFHSTLSNLIARHELIEAGVRLEAIGSIEHLKNGEAVAYSVSEGRFDVGAVEDLVAYRYEDKGLRAIHVSEPVPSAPLVVREDLPRRVSAAIQEALLKLDFAGAKDREHWDEDIRYGFAPATDADYEPVRRIMKTSPTGCEGSCHRSP